MIFKNRKGDVNWYVVSLLIALLVFAVAFGAIRMLKGAQEGAVEPKDNLCRTVGGECKAACAEGSERDALTPCPAPDKCCVTL